MDLARNCLRLPSTMAAATTPATAAMPMISTRYLTLTFRPFRLHRPTTHINRRPGQTPVVVVVVIQVATAGVVAAGVLANTIQSTAATMANVRWAVRVMESLTATTEVKKNVRLCSSNEVWRAKIVRPTIR